MGIPASFIQENEGEIACDNPCCRARELEHVSMKAPPVQDV